MANVAPYSKKDSHPSDWISGDTICPSWRFRIFRFANRRLIFSASSRKKDGSSFMTRRSIAGWITFFCFCMLSGCRAAERTIEISNPNLGVTPSMETLARGLIEAYRLASPQETPFQITVSSAEDLRSGLDQGRVSAVLQWESPVPDDWAAALGWTGIVFVVNPQNTVANISRNQARNIFLGLIDQWGDVGGSPGDIHRLAYTPDQDMEVLFQGIVLDSDRTANGFQAVPAPYAMRDAVGKDKNSIGFLLGFDISQDVHPLTIDHTTAEYPNLLSSRYPFRVPVYLISKNPVPSQVSQFAGWAQSVDGQSVFLAMQPWE
jgi:hypothetical protein